MKPLNVLLLSATLSIGTVSANLAEACQPAYSGELTNFIAFKVSDGVPVQAPALSITDLNAGTEASYYCSEPFHGSSQGTNYVRFNCSMRGGYYRIALKSASHVFPVKTQCLTGDSVGSGLLTAPVGLPQPGSVPSLVASGKVIQPSGLPLSNTQVRILNLRTGQLSIATTSSFGLFSVAGITLDSDIEISVQSKRYRFAGRRFNSRFYIPLSTFQGLE